MQLPLALSHPFDPNGEWWRGGMERTFFIALHITCQTEVVRGHDT